MATRYLLFNQTSGSYSPRRAARIKEMLRNAGISAIDVFPSSEAEAISTVGRICREGGQPLILVAGGDGTINTVINGMEKQSATLGVIPLGTANVLVRELGITSVGDAIARIATAVSRPFSVGLAETSAASRRFLLMAGIGIDGAIVAGVTPREKRHLGKFAYLLSALRTAAAWDRTPVTVTDGSRSATCHSVVVANAAHYGGAFQIAPGADIFTPALQVVPLSTFTRGRFIRYALNLVLSGKAPQGGTLWKFSGGRLTIDGAKAVQLDGDSFGAGPLTISILEDFNEIIV